MDRSSKNSAGAHRPAKCPAGCGHVVIVVRRRQRRPHNVCDGDQIGVVAAGCKRTTGTELDHNHATQAAKRTQISPIGAARITVSTRRLAVQNGG
jgi:hypothetical protein